MTVKITMPKLKENIDSAILCAWHVDVGDKVSIGDVMYEVEVDKVVSEIEAEENMVILSIEVEEGDEISVGDVLATAEIID